MKKAQWIWMQASVALMAAAAAAMARDGSQKPATEGLPVLPESI